MFPNQLFAIDRCARVGALFVGLSIALGTSAVAQTDFGEIEGRPAPVSRRQCVGGANLGALCNQDANCPGSTCQPSNLFNLDVAVRFDATDAELDAIEQAFIDGSELLFDVTDGQAQFGRVTIFDNAAGLRGHYWIVPGGGVCGASTGTFGTYNGGNIDVPMNRIGTATDAGCLAHEFVHFVFDARDEYQQGCGLPSTTDATCPDDAQGTSSAAEEACLMICCTEVGTELCWGQASGDNLTAGNHDATNVTEQSRCRSNRSCWDQVGWSWPTTMLVPAGAPNPAANGLVHQDVDFLRPASTARLVLALDRSGSMSSESPSRLERLKTAALDVVDIAEEGIELGLVSFSSNATEEVGIEALGADRSAFTDAIDDLSAGGATNIGAALQLAHDMILDEGEVTAETAVILMTDGRNNQPAGSAQTDLDEKVALLLDAGIPVYVTCTGDDLGLNSQCAEIGAGTGGSYVDSEVAGFLPQRFVSFYERLKGRHPAVSYRDDFRKSQYRYRYPVEIEPGARAATFVVQWRHPKTTAWVGVVDPDGNSLETKKMPLGTYLRVDKPKPGTWLVRIDPGTVAGNDTTLTVDGYIDNQLLIVPTAARQKVVQPGEPFHVCAWPLQTRRITNLSITGEVTTPSGVKVPIYLLDNGQAENGDEIASDGTFCAMFTETEARGAYTFRLRTVASQPQEVIDPQPGAKPYPIELVPFRRWQEFSATVDDLVADKPVKPADLRFEISPFLGLFDVDSNLPIEDGAVRGVRAAGSRWARWDVEAELAHTPTDDVRGNGGDILQVSLNGLYHFADPPRRWRPFVTLGVGGLFFTGFSTKDEVFAWNGGVGLKVQLIRNIGLRGEVRSYSANGAFGGSSTDNLQATGALVFRLD